VITGELEGSKCFECGGPATIWRAYKSPIVPWCDSCRWECWEQQRGRMTGQDISCKASQSRLKSCGAGYSWPCGNPGIRRKSPGNKLSRRNMSYSLISKCHECVLEDKCVDKAILYGAISGIHGVNAYSSKQKACINKGHLGGGDIELNCVNFVQQEDTAKQS
jgi:hypothetical protein